MPPKILVIRFSSIGDIVLTTPVIRALKTQFSGGEVELHFLTKTVNRDILAANPYIDQLHTIDRKIAEVSARLKRERFTYVIDLHRNLRSFQIKRLLGRPCHSVDKLDLRRLLYIYFKINLMPSKHIVDRYMEVVRPLGVTNDMRGLDYFLRPQDMVDPAALPVTHRQGYIAIVIGGKHAGKLYPLPLLVQLCKQLTLPVILLGGAGDQQRGDRIVEQTGSQVFNACGKFSLNESATLVRDAQCVISNDTGLMHIASAFHKKIISLWGATVPQFGMYPYLPGPGSHMLEAVSADRPYSKHGGKALFKAPYNCWTGLEPEKIVQAVHSGA